MKCSGVGVLSVFLIDVAAIVCNKTTFDSIPSVQTATVDKYSLSSSSPFLHLFSVTSELYLIQVEYNSSILIDL